jgi:hypothetical protein
MDIVCTPQLAVLPDGGTCPHCRHALTFRLTWDEAREIGRTAEAVVAGMPGIDTTTFPTEGRDY